MPQAWRVGGYSNCPFKLEASVVSLVRFGLEIAQYSLLYITIIIPDEMHLTCGAICICIALVALQCQYCMGAIAVPPHTQKVRKYRLDNHENWSETKGILAELGNIADEGCG